MSDDDDNVLFVRGDDETNADDVWDDSALIKAYDEAISLAKEEVSKRLGLESETEDKPETKPQKKSQSKKQTGQAHKSQKKWFVGSPCRAVYSEDGEIYEAVITKIQENAGTCTVKFIGYNNKEKVSLSTLLESEGLQSQIAQTKEAEASVAAELPQNSMEFDQSRKVNGSESPLKGFGIPMDFDFGGEKSFMFKQGPSFNPSCSTMPPAPPLPPSLMASFPENDADALSSMLMSWYMSGFHTGYYHGMKQAQSDHRHKKK